MGRRFPGALVAIRRVLRALIALNLLTGFAILALLVASMLQERLVMDALGAPPTPGNSRLILGMRRIMVLGVAAVPLAHVVLTRLVAIVDTLGIGDPFVADNAARLVRIAWAVLGLELTHLAVGFVSAGASTDAGSLDVGWSFSFTRWLAVLLIFVLARVFEQGTRMREDLAGTV